MTKTLRSGAKTFRLARLAGALGRFLHPSAAFSVGSDLLGLSARQESTKHHLAATMQWLCRAQDATGSGGVAAGYSLIDGWLPPYPETTGYIIPTFFDYARHTGLDHFRARALRMADWEIEIQLPSGAVQAGWYHGRESERRPAVFNTGQVILGWCRAFVESKDERYLQAALEAGNWLVGVQMPDGSWRLPAPMTETTIHAYDVRTAWSLLVLNEIADEARYANAARLNLEWTLTQQRENGWFENNAFYLSRDKVILPLTHTIAYVLEGFQGARNYLNEQRYLDAVVKPAERLMRMFERRGFLPGECDSDWQSAASYSCLTGNAQMAGVWLRLYETCRDTRFLNAALKLNDYVKGTQALRSLHAGIRGGVKGSQPIYGDYMPFVFNNWGAKFLADSLMLEEHAMASVDTAGLSRPT